MFRLFFALKRLVWKIIWHSVYFFLCRPKMLILAFVIALFGLYYYNDSVKNAQHYQVSEKKVVLPSTTLPELKFTPQNGNGRLHRDIVLDLDEDNGRFYAAHYQYAMMSGADDTPYLWVGNDYLFGKITPGKLFTTKRGNRCRKFAELLHTPTAAQRKDGIGCERSDKLGWCRLPARATPNCAISFAPRGMLDKLKRLF